MKPTIAIITPTTGSSHLLKVLESVKNQLYNNIVHYIVIDGEEYAKSTMELISLYQDVKIITLPFNTGKGGFNGHRIYAASSYIINEEYFFFLDEDNWYDENHVSSLMELLINEDLDWAYSLRKICSHDGIFITDDNCESLGDWEPFSGYSKLVDTNCYAIKKNTMLNYGSAWYHRRGADRNFYRILSSNITKYSCSKLYTVNYRIHENRPPFSSYFIRGNTLMLEKYNYHLPWAK